MPELALIKAFLYDPHKVKIDRVIAPPYDVISDEERHRLEALDPHNCVRLILPQGEGDQKYDNARKTLDAWLAEGVLKRDARPAIFRYHQEFQLKEVGTRKFVRRGIVAAVRLAPYDEKVILPHERTLRGPKEDRLKLMRACEAHFSQIFGLYRDPSLQTDHAFSGVEGHAPDLQGATADGTLHKLWRVTDRETIAQVGKVMGPLKVYIADGHHRYETMLALRDELRAKHGNQLGYRAAPEYATFFLTNMSDPGLVVLPTHRLVHSLASFAKDDVLARAREFFQVTTIEGGAKDTQKLKQALFDSGKLHASFAMVVPGSDDAWMLVLQTDPRLPVIKALQLLDVSVLHGVILERYLGIDREAQEQQRNITYVKDTADALARVQKGEAQAGFIMNPTRVDQVLDVADHGGTMPQKSTFFYPKIASGLVINPIHVDEDLDKSW